ncbi:M23 family metallopeptidase [candidate division WOR-3 bacterium]|nr:M23 family metallopeptidase [candidate division WOR-3 bacterium]
MPETPVAPQHQHGPLPPFHGRPVPPRPKEPPRYGRWVAVGLTLGFIVALILLAVLVPRAHRVRENRKKAQARAQAQAEAAAFDTTAYVVKPNEVMTSLLSRAGFSTQDIGRVVPALRAAGFNLRAMRPGDSLFVLRKRDQGIEGSRDQVTDEGPAPRLLYAQGVTRVYRVDVASGEVRVSMLYKYITMTAAFVKGTIKGSLYETMMALGETPQLIMDYTDIFGWEIDFFSEVQPNDSFAILFERKYCDSSCIGYGVVLAATYWGQIGLFSGYRFTDPEGTTDYYNAEGQNLRKTFQKSPLRFSRVSSFFGRRFHPILRRVRQHSGVDYVAPRGTPVEVVSDGRVASAGWSGGYGRLVVVRHAEGYETRYGHLSGFAKGIRSGASVKQGQLVGYVGSTGLSTGPHLHYEVRKFGSAVNPLRLKPPRRSPVKKAFLPQFGRTRDSLARILARLGSGYDTLPGLGHDPN